MAAQTQPETDIAILGGGIIGRAIAHACAQRFGGDQRITLIDGAGAINKHNASAVAAGMLAPSFEIHPTDGQALYDFGCASRDLWPALAQVLRADTGIDVDLQQAGTLGAAVDEQSLTRLHADYTALSALGGAAKWLSGDEARALEPTLGPAICGAMFVAADGQVDPRKATQAFGMAMSRRPNFRLWSAKISRIDWADNDQLCLHSEAGGVLRAASLVLASGAGLMVGPRMQTSSDALTNAQQTSGPLLGDGAAFPVKGEVVALTGLATAPKHVVRAPAAYICPKQNGQVIIGATEIPRADDVWVDERRAEHLLASGINAVPSLAGHGQHRYWAGLRPATRDGLPIIGRSVSGPSNLIFALGHHRNGVLFAPKTAQLVADALGDPTGAEFPTAFAPARFFVPA